MNEQIPGRGVAWALPCGRPALFAGANRACRARVGSDLFIIDNTNSELDVLRYLAGWRRLSRGLDVASAYFEIGSLLALDRHWQKVDTTRLLLGDEITKKTKRVLAEALKGHLDASIEDQKVRDDFLDGVPAIVDAITPGSVEIMKGDRIEFTRNDRALARENGSRATVVAIGADDRTARIRLDKGTF